MATFNGVLPDLDDSLTAPFWAAAKDHRLSVQQCQRCSALRWVPAPICPECLDTGGEWVTLSGSGTIWSYAVYHRAMSSEFAGAVPYAVAMIELDEGPRMVGQLADSTATPAIGHPVTAVFEAATPDVTLVRWALA